MWKIFRGYGLYKFPYIEMSILYLVYGFKNKFDKFLCKSIFLLGFTNQWKIKISTFSCNDNSIKSSKFLQHFKHILLFQPWIGEQCTSLLIAILLFYTYFVIKYYTTYSAKCEHNNIAILPIIALLPLLQTHSRILHLK